MIFEIPFNAKISLEQYTLRLKLTFKRNLTTSVKNLVGSGVIIFFGWLMVSDKGNIGYFYLSLGFFYLFNAIHYFRYYFKTRKKLKRIYQDVVDLREKNKDTTTWAFESDVFRYRDMHYEYSIKWEAFKGYKIIQTNLFLLVAESIQQSFIIGEAEVGEAEFKMIIDLIALKIKKLDEQ